MAQQFLPQARPDPRHQCQAKLGGRYAGWKERVHVDPILAIKEGYCIPYYSYFCAFSVNRFAVGGIAWERASRFFAGGPEGRVDRCLSRRDRRDSRGAPGLEAVSRRPSSTTQMVQRVQLVD